MSEVGLTLTALDPEPPPGTLVRDDCGNRWENDGNCPSAWVDPDDDGYGRARTWTKVAGNYGPVTVVEWGGSE